MLGGVTATARWLLFVSATGTLAACAARPAATMANPPTPSAHRSAPTAQPTPPTARLRPPPAPAAATASAVPAAPAPAPAHFTDLPVPGHQPAYLWVPAGSDRRPLMVVAHGAGGHAEWHCRLWRGITGGRAFVLCPRGTHIRPDDASGYYYKNDPALESEVLAAVAALGKAYPRADATAAVYAGYSQGAMMGALMAERHPELFARLVLVEGGHDWDIPTARRWHDGGGLRVLFVCGRRVCDKDARRASGWLKHGGVKTRVEYAPGAGHTPSGSVAKLVGAAFNWVVQGDARWRR